MRTISSLSSAQLELRLATTLFVLQSVGLSWHCPACACCCQLAIGILFAKHIKNFGSD